MRLLQTPGVLCVLSRAEGTYSGLSNPKYVNTAQSGKENFEKCFEKSHVKTNLFQKLLLGVGSGVISITSPSRGDMIAVMGEVTGLQAWKYIHTKMLQSNEGKQILEEKPRISSGAVDIEKLKSYPNGTLGKAYSNFLEKYGYTPDTRNAVQFVDNLELAYVAQRYREAHDLFHTLLDMPTNMLGEVTVKWVEAIQLKLPMCAAGALFGSVRLAPKFSRSYSTKAIIKLDTSLAEKIENHELSPKKHPGVMKLPCVDLPEKISTTITSLLRNDRKQLVKEAIALRRKVECRQLPVERAEKGRLRKQFMNYMRQIKPAPIMDFEWQEVMESHLSRQLKYVCYNWKPINFDKKTTRQYLLSRTPGEYAAVKRVFNEIFRRDKDFAPKNLLDFGSGVGTVTWAANGYWGNTLKEYYCVDASREMNELALKILRSGDINNPPLIPNVYLRDCLPYNPKPYDIVVSAFTFFELSSCKQRLKTLSTLWNSTTNYLVLIENGTLAGFHLISEARDFIVNVSKEHEVDCYIFSPCPHELECPRIKAPGKRIPCNFPVMYNENPMFDKIKTRSRFFSYIIFKKGPKPPDDDRNWRIINNVLKRHKHAVCQLCTTDGELNRYFFTASKYGKPAYKCMRFSNWGDLAPGSMNKLPQEPDAEDATSIGDEVSEGLIDAKNEDISSTLVNTCQDSDNSIEETYENTSESLPDTIDDSSTNTSDSLPDTIDDSSTNTSDSLPDTIDDSSTNTSDSSNDESCKEKS